MATGTTRRNQADPAGLSTRRGLNLLDENFPADQKSVLKGWGIPFRKIGTDVARLGVKDLEIISLLHTIRHVTFFTQDKGFGDPALCHRAYCLVWLDVRPDDAALYLRRFLKHPRFNTQSKRMGLVVRVERDSIKYCQRNRQVWRQESWI